MDVCPHSVFQLFNHLFWEILQNYVYLLVCLVKLRFWCKVSIHSGIRSPFYEGEGFWSGNQDELDALWHHIFTSAVSSGLWPVNLVAVPWVLGELGFIDSFCIHFLVLWKDPWLPFSVAFSLQWRIGLQTLYHAASPTLTWEPAAWWENFYSF